MNCVLSKTYFKLFVDMPTAIYDELILKQNRYYLFNLPLYLGDQIFR